MINEIYAEIEKMTDAEIETLLGTEFPEEMEKQASADLDLAELNEALYTLGALQAEKDFAEDVEGLDKVAAEEIEQFDAAVTEVSEIVDAKVVELGIDNTEGAEMHKFAQDMAAQMFLGYADGFEKLAAKAKSKKPMPKEKSLMEKIKGLSTKAQGKIKAGYKSTAGKIKAGYKSTAGKHPGKAGLIGGAILGSAALHMAKKHMDKKASELTVSEISEIVREEATVEAVAFDGIEMLEKVAANKATVAKKALGFLDKVQAKAKNAEKAVSKKFEGIRAHVAKHKMPYTTAAAAGAGFAAGRESKE